MLVSGTVGLATAVEIVIEGAPLLAAAGEDEEAELAEDCELDEEEAPGAAQAVCKRLSAARTLVRNVFILKILPLHWWIALKGESWF